VTDDFPPFTTRHMSKEGFEQLLIEIRNGANATLVGFAAEEVMEGKKHDAKIETCEPSGTRPRSHSASCTSRDTSRSARLWTTFGRCWIVTKG
jgi:hypothetical protein